MQAKPCGWNEERSEANQRSTSTSGPSPGGERRVGRREGDHLCRKRTGLLCRPCLPMSQVGGGTLTFLRSICIYPFEYFSFTSRCAGIIILTGSNGGIQANGMCEPDKERVSDHGEKVALGIANASKDHPSCENATSADRGVATKSKSDINLTRMSSGL